MELFKYGNFFRKLFAAHTNKKTVLEMKSKLRSQLLGAPVKARQLTHHSLTNKRKVCYLEFWGRRVFEYDFFVHVKRVHVTTSVLSVASSFFFFAFCLKPTIFSWHVQLLLRNPAILFFSIFNIYLFSFSQSVYDKKTVFALLSIRKPVISST